MIVYLMRHGQTTGDIEDRFGGDYEDSLTAKGRKQVKSAAKKLLGKGIKSILSSPRIRAQQSAKIIARKLGLPVHVVNNWRERNFYGILTGMTKKDAQQKHPNLIELVQSYKNTLPKGETYSAFKKRILEVFDRTRNLRNEAVLVITHGGPITCIGREILGKEFKVTDCGILKVQAGNSVTLQELNGIEIKK